MGLIVLIFWYILSMTYKAVNAHLTKLIDIFKGVQPDAFLRTISDGITEQSP